MKTIFTTIILIFISCSLYAVDTSYIPANSSIVASAKVDTLSQKAGVDTKTLLNNLILRDLSQRYATLRKDKRVSKAIENITDILDFSKSTRFTSANNMFYAVMFDIKDIKQLDKIMLLLARGEDTVVQVIEEGIFRYLELDEYFAIAWNDEVFIILKKGRYANFDYIEENEEIQEQFKKMGLVKSNLEYAKKIFSKNDLLKSDTFLSLEKENNDINFWMNSSLVMQMSTSLNYILYSSNGYEEILEKIIKEYEDSSYTVSINFEKGLATAVINSYTPKSSFDSMKLKKSIDKKVYEFSPNDAFGFLSMAVNTDIIAAAVEYMIKDTELETYINEYLANEGLGDIGGVTDLISSLGGDMFLSLWYDEENIETQNIAGVLGISFKNQNMARKITDYLVKNFEASEENENLYTDGYSGVYVYLKENIIYIGTEKVISDVVENKISTLSKDKETLIQNNMFSLYVDINYISNILYENGYIGRSDSEIFQNFNSLEITSNPVSKTQSKTVIKIKVNNTDYNSMKVLYDILESLSAVNGVY